jgi:hypothetical protein
VSSWPEGSFGGALEVFDSDRRYLFHSRLERKKK